MSQTAMQAMTLLRDLMQRLAFLAIAAAALGLSGYTLACALGAAPWLDMQARFGDWIYPQAGPAVQIGVTALALMLGAFLPSNARIMALETSHRRFHMGMRDVARAYAVAHAADRDGVFTLSSEFDSIRERIAFLRRHPDLDELEPPVLELAAQMSHVSRELARIYSDANVARAQDFLHQRQQEIEDFNTRLDHAKAVATEMRGWLHRIEIEESVAEAQLARLCDALTEILPELETAASGAQDATQTAALAAEAANDDAQTAAEAAWPRRGHLDEGFDGDDNRIVELLSRRRAAE
ncbi:MAG: DNA repair protein [Paracoccaceae bacterium]